MLRMCTNKRLPLVPCRFAGTLHPPEPHVHNYEDGNVIYSRNWSRDKKLTKYFTPPQKGDFFPTFLVRRLGHAYELYPLLFILSFAGVVGAMVAYWSTQKIEVRADGSHHSVPNYSWERVRDNYWKYHTVALDPEGLSHRRLPIMEKIEEDMLAEAKKRHGGESTIETYEHEAYEPCHN